MLERQSVGFIPNAWGTTDCLTTVRLTRENIATKGKACLINADAFEALQTKTEGVLRVAFE